MWRQGLKTYSFVVVYWLLFVHAKTRFWSNISLTLISFAMKSYMYMQCVLSCLNNDLKCWKQKSKCLKLYSITGSHSSTSEVRLPWPVHLHKLEFSGSWTTNHRISFWLCPRSADLRKFIRIKPIGMTELGCIQQCVQCKAGGGGVTRPSLSSPTNWTHRQCWECNSIEGNTNGTGTKGKHWQLNLNWREVHNLTKTQPQCYVVCRSDQHEGWQEIVRFWILKQHHQLCPNLVFGILYLHWVSVQCSKLQSYSKIDWDHRYLANSQICLNQAASGVWEWCCAPQGFLFLPQGLLPEK